MLPTMEVVEETREMKISLVLCTLGRFDEVKAFLTSLTNQEYKNFEVILIDQNEKGYLDTLVNMFNDIIVIKHYYCSPGLSKARNFGMQYVSGDIMCFPDDDCEYFSDTLKVVNDSFSTLSSDILIGSSVTRELNPSGVKFAKDKLLLTKNDIVKYAISYTVFLKLTKNSNLIRFDENLGVGSGTEYGSGEETDFLIRLIGQGCEPVYIKSLQVYHPEKKNMHQNFNRALSYGKGLGYVFNKNNMSMLDKLIILSRPLIGAGLSFLTMNFKMTKFYIYSFLGRFLGLIKNVD